MTTPSDPGLDAVMSERRQLINLAYRLLGSLAEAEDAVQETYARPADRVTLDESVNMAFLVILESMTPAERVAFILHDVFGYSFAEVRRADREIGLLLFVRGIVRSKSAREGAHQVPSPVVHFEIRSADPDATREFFGKLFGWTFPDGGIPGYSYVDSGIEGAIPGGISPLQGGEPLVTFFVGVQDVAATLDAAVAQGGKIIQPATSVPGVTFGLLADPQGQVVGLASADS